MKRHGHHARRCIAYAWCLLVACARPVDDIVSDDQESFPQPSGGTRAGSGGKAGSAPTAGKSGLPLAGTSTGGSVGTPSTAGRGGKAATEAGASSLDEGGSTPVEAGGASSVDVPAELQVLHKTGSGDATDNQIRVGLRLASAASSPADLSALELRYYFTSEVALPLVIEVYDAAITGTVYRTVNKDALKVEVTGADAYLKVSFTEAAGVLAAGDALTLDLTVHGQNWTGNFAEADDYSFAPGHSEFTAWDHVTLFGAKNLLWGKEPP